MRALLVLAAAAATMPIAAAAVEPALGSALTLYGGYRGGGGFTDASSGRSLDLKGAGAFGASLDLPLDAKRQYQLFVSHQGTKLDDVAATSGEKFRMSVTYFHIGGTNFFDGRVGSGPYVVGGIGATLFSPGLDGYSSEVRASMNIGFGYQWPLADRVSLRFEVRGYVTLIDSDSDLFCSGGCVVRIQGDTFTQGEALIGLSARF